MMTSTGLRRLGLAAATAMAVILTAPAFGQAPAPVAAGSVTTAARFDIAPQALSTALLAFGRQSGYQVSYPPEDVDGIGSPGVLGTMEPEAALRALLSGTGAVYRLTAAGSVVISRPAAQSGALGLTSLEAITVTASRADRLVAETPASVQVIERAEIQRQLEFSASPSDALAKLVPGYSPSNQTVSGASQTFRGRDLLVMLDGVPLNTPLRDVSRTNPLIDLNAVERIEVVAGASSLYGSGATGGTVNFITRKAEDGKPTVSVNGAVRAFTANIGQSLAPELSGTVSGIANGTDYVATVTGRTARKTYDGSGNEMPSDPMIGQGGGDRYGNLNLLGKVGHDFGEKRVEATAMWNYFNQNPAYLSDYTKSPVQPSFNQPYPAQSIMENSGSFALRYADNDFALGRLNLQAFYNRIEKRFGFATASPVNPIVYYSGNPRAPIDQNGITTLHTDRGGLNATVDTDLDRLYRGLRLTWGGDLTLDNTRQTFPGDINAIAPMRQAGYAAFAQLEAPVFDRVTVKGGVRYESFNLDVSSFRRPAYVAYYLYGPNPVLAPAVNMIGGSFTYSAATFNAGAVVRITDNVDVYGGFSQGFSLPDIGSFTRRAGLGLPANSTVNYSNIGPKAQIVDNYELGLRGNWNTVRGSLAGFVSTSDEGVNFDARTNTVSQQKEIIYGVELAGEVDVTRSLTLGANLTWREGKYDKNQDGSIDAYLPNNRLATPFRTFLYGSYTFETGTMVRLEGEYFSGRNRIPNGTIEAGGTVNLLLNQPLWGGKVYLSAQNLLDRTYENPTATATRDIPVNAWGRTITLGYNKTF